MTRWLRPVLLAPILVLGACQDEGGACAAVFQIYTVSLRDPGGAPVTDAVVTPILVRTGDTLQNTTLALFAPGTYFLIDDSYAPRLFRNRDSVSVSITRGPAALQAGYAFRRGSCGAEKIAGPDSVTVP